MFVEIHMLQNFSPSNLNRDDTGSPKDCEFGGYRRARISSQCQKRAIRMAFETGELLPPSALGLRTKRVVNAIVQQLSDLGREPEDSRRIAESVLTGIGLGVSEDQTEYLLFLGRDEIEFFTRVCDDHWDTLSSLTSSGQSGKKAAKAGLPKDVSAALAGSLDGRKAADVALFGRMLADMPIKNRDAASQVAHAISTNRLDADFDFFTAVDDLKTREEDAGAGMLGTVEFNSSCFYRYANIDLRQLLQNLGEDEEMAKATIQAFLRAAISAVPTGKQNSFAAQNPPSMVFVVLRNGGLWSLANAFVKPVHPSKETDLIGESVKRLDDYWRRLTEMYGEKGVAVRAIAIDSGYADRLTTLDSDRVAGVDALVDRVLGGLSLASSKA
ncbi:type I-E CRISPR-associated protein Cas7/Cse4/CasC [soil metagenome]